MIFLSIFTPLVADFLFYNIHSKSQAQDHTWTANATLTTWSGSLEIKVNKYKPGHKVWNQSLFMLAQYYYHDT